LRHAVLSCATFTFPKPLHERLREQAALHGGLMRDQPVLAFGWAVNSLAAFSMASLSLAASMVPRGSARFRRISMRHRAMGHHPIAQAIMWRTVTMMMAEAMAMSASKRTLCLRRSILRMRFIAIASRSGSVVSVALSS
jgi:hypothetical protein